jgi:alkyl sulfatase BDS1-like metallo-beta-lactamase superfamily hydrolase
LRLLNQGYTGDEIAEMIELPPALTNSWSTHGYFGSVSHNVKAIYQRYMGWFDGNPARLWPHPPAALAARYVDALGGVDRVVELAQAAVDTGDYRWAATLLDHAVFVDADHDGARSLYAGGTRAAHADAAVRLARHLRQRPRCVGHPTVPRRHIQRHRHELSAHAPQRRAHPPRTTGRRHGRCDRDGDQGEAAQTLLAGDTSSPGIDIAGDTAVLDLLLCVLEKGDPDFNIVTP